MRIPDPVCIWSVATLGSSSVSGHHAAQVASWRVAVTVGLLLLRRDDGGPGTGDVWCGTGVGLTTALSRLLLADLPVRRSES